MIDLVMPTDSNWLDESEDKSEPQAKVTMIKTNMAVMSLDNVEHSSSNEKSWEENGNSVMVKRDIDSGGDSHQMSKENLEGTKENFAERTFKKKILSIPLTFWYLKNENTQEWNWKHNQAPVVTVKSSEQFWSIYNYIELPSKLDDGCDYSVFKKGVSPDWEHRDNIKGGRWILAVKKGESVDEMWQKLITLMLVEDMLVSVNGVVVSKRKSKGDRLAVWLRDDKDDEVMKVGSFVKNMFKVEDRFQFFPFYKQKKYKVRGKGD